MSFTSSVVWGEMGENDCLEILFQKCCLGRVSLGEPQLLLAGRLLDQPSHTGVLEQTPCYRRGHRGPAAHTCSLSWCCKVNVMSPVLNKLSRVTPALFVSEVLMKC